MHIPTRHHYHECCHIHNGPYLEQYYLTSMSLLLDLSLLMQHYPYGMLCSFKATFTFPHQVNHRHRHSFYVVPHVGIMYCINSYVSLVMCLGLSILGIHWYTLMAQSISIPCVFSNSQVAHLAHHIQGCRR